MLDAGTKAPDFSLENAANQSVSLSDSRGKLTVLYFYPKDDTKGCTQQAIDFTADAPAFKKSGAVIIGVSPDNAKSHQKFIDKHDLGIELLADDTKEVVQNYGVWVEKSMYGRKYMGVERTTFLIDTKGKIIRVWRKVKVKGHVEEVLDAVKNTDS